MVFQNQDNKDNMDIQKYLPSQKFRTFLKKTFIILIIFFLIWFLLSKKEIFSAKKELSVKENKTVEDYLKQDTDKDGIYDWEEEIWGTDKNKKNTFGISDKEYIKNKKAELQINEEINVEELTETDRFAREFFSSYAALKSSGEVDSLTIDGFYSALGQKIVTPEGEDKYKEIDLKINDSDSEATKNAYYEKIKSIFQKYREEGMGDEIDILGEGLLDYSNTNQNTLKAGELLLISEAYAKFGEEIMQTEVPRLVRKQHLKLANGAYNLSTSVLSISKVINDPLVGLSGVSQYEEYSANFVSAVEEIETILGI